MPYQKTKRSPVPSVSHRNRSIVWKPGLVTFLICLIVFFLPSLSSLHAGDKHVTVVYTANSSGKFRACGCPNDPYGGLAERVTFIKQLREREKHFLLVDGGNMVSLFGSFEKRAEGVMRIMNLMGYNAAGIGCNELFYGVGKAQSMKEKAGFPLLSASVEEENDDKIIFQSHVIVEVESVSVGITAVGDSTSLTKIGIEKVHDYRWRPLEKTMEEALGTLEGACDIIIVISQLPPEENVLLIEQYPVIDLIVESFTSKRYDPPVSLNGGIIVSPGYNGQYVGKIILSKTKDNTIRLIESAFFPVMNYPEDEKAREIVKEYYKNLK